MEKNKVQNSINYLIMESDLSYGEAIDLLKFLVADYLQKGNDLLNNTDIQKVVMRTKN